MNGLIGKKVGMTQIFSDNGDEIPVTALTIGPCPVTQLKTVTKDGYNAVQLAFEPIIKKNKNKIPKPRRGHFEKIKLKPHRYLREFRTDGDENLKIGDTVGVDFFDDTNYVSVTGISKGRGFAGVVKRHGQKGASATRGSHERFRHPGSIGMCEYPARVIKGTKLPGHMGASKVTALNLEVVKIFKEQNLLLVRGAAPGPNGGVVVVTKSTRKKKRVAPKVVVPKKKGGR